jgi:hypothetical protein
MNTLTRTGVSMVTLLSAIGCGGAGPSDSSPSSTAPADTSTGGTTSSPALPQVSIHGFVHASDGTLLPGTTACLRADVTKNVGDCKTAGGDGSFTLSAPANEWVAVTLQKNGFVPTLRAIQTQTSDITLPENENSLLPVVTPQTILGMPADAGRGHVAFSVTAPNGQSATAVSVTMSGADGSSQSPIYLDSDGSPAAGVATGTQGRFVNVPPGLYVLRFGRPSANCAPMGLYGWPMTAYEDPSSGEAAVVVPVLEGYVTAPVAASCGSAQ